MLTLIVKLFMIFFFFFFGIKNSESLEIGSF